MKSNNYYNPKNILKKGADYNLIIGQRSNGKTYGFCSIALTSHINEGARVAYVRRYSEDITKKNIENLFCPTYLVWKKLSKALDLINLLKISFC